MSEGKDTMKNRLTFICGALAFGFLSLPALAATPQQEKMKTCNADFKTSGKPGSEHKAFMKTCLSAKAAAPAEAAASATPQQAQQNKMKTCSADFKATGKPGAERKAFMKECLSK
jgi:hypothetical protein